MTRQEVRPVRDELKRRQARNKKGL